ncbi:MAG: oligosaccharide flippase family protein [Candidatus Margulisiibacteriota bacterium]
MIKRFLNKIKSDDIGSTLKHSRNYFGGNLAIKALSVISIPIFTRMLTLNEYGIVNLYGSAASILSVLMTFNLFTSVGRYYYEDKKDIGGFISSIVIAFFPLFVINAIIAYIFRDNLSSWLGIPVGLFFPLMVFILLTLIDSINRQILEAERKSQLLVALDFSKAFLAVSCSIALVFVFVQARYLGLIWGQIIGGIIVSTYCLKLLKKYVSFEFKFEYLKYALYLGLPLIPYTLSGVILAQADRIIINNVQGAASAGIYSLGSNIGMILQSFILSVNSALIPDFFHFLNIGENVRLDRLVKKAFILIVVFAFLLMIFSPEIVMVLAGRKYCAGIPIIPWIVMGNIFFAMFTIYARYIGYSKQMIYGSVISIACGLISIVLNIFFIPLYGYMAAAYTSTLSYLIMFLLTWFVVKHVLKMHVTPLKYLTYTFSIFFLFAGLYYIFIGIKLSMLLYFVCKILLFLLFLCFISFPYFSPQKYLAVLRGFIRKAGSSV